MAERVQIVLEAQDLASGVLRGLVSRFGTLGNVVSDASDAFGRFSNFMSLANAALTDSSISTADLEKSYAELGTSMARLGETIAVALVQMVQEAIKVTDEYNGQIRDLSLVSGEGAEATSRFIQVLDDYELTAEDAMTAAKALKEKGLSPTIDTLAMLSDEFKKIKDPAERMAFVQENLGKGGAKWVNVLNQESDALRKAAASIDPWLVKTDEQIKKAEISRLALDELGDSWAAFQNRIGDAKNELIFANEASQRAYEILQEQGVAINHTTNRTEAYRDAVKQAEEELLKTAESSIAYNESLEEQAKKAEEAQKALEELSKANAALITGAIEITNNQKAYQEEQQGVLDKIAETRAEGEKLYPWEHEKILENKAALEELGNQYFENQEKFRAAQEERAAMMAIEAIALSDGVAGYSDAERERARVVLETADVATAAAFEEQEAMTALSQAVADGSLPVENWGSVFDQVMADGVVSVEEVQAAIDAVPKENVVNFTITTTGTPPNLSMVNDDTAARGTHRVAGGRALGGTVMGGELYQVAEKGSPEMLNIDGRDYLMTPKGSNGTVTPMSSQGGRGNADIIAALYATRLDEGKVANMILEGLLQERR